MRAAAVALLLPLFGVLAAESVLAQKSGARQGGGVQRSITGASSGHRPVVANAHQGHRPVAGAHHGHRHHGHHHHHHGVSFVGVGVGFAYPWSWYYPPYYPYYPYYPQPVAYPAQPVTYVEQGGAPATAEPAGWWYYCEPARAYYPYVKECPGGWQRVPALPPPPN